MNHFQVGAFEGAPSRAKPFFWRRKKKAQHHTFRRIDEVDLAGLERDRLDWTSLDVCCVELKVEVDVDVRYFDWIRC